MGVNSTCTTPWLYMTNIFMSKSSICRRKKDNMMHSLYSSSGILNQHTKNIFLIIIIIKKIQIKKTGLKISSGGHPLSISCVWHLAQKKEAKKWSLFDPNPYWYIYGLFLFQFMHHPTTYSKKIYSYILIELLFRHVSIFKPI